MKAKLIKESIENDNSCILVHVNYSHPRILGKIKKILEESYNNVEMSGTARAGWTLFFIYDKTANVADVSDELFYYIEKGIVETVEETDM